MSNIKYIDPMIGTIGAVEGHIHGGGKTYPGAVAPGGMVQLSPDTITAGDNGSGYNYTDNTIEGFSINHLSGVGWYGDLGNFQVMPVVGDTDLRSGSYQWMPLKKGTKGWKSEFSHDTEVAKAGYYAVTLERYNIRTECTVSTHAGLMRLTYPETDSAKIIFNLPRRIAGIAEFQSVKIIDNKRLEGFIRCDHKLGGFGYGDGGVDYTLYFCCELSKVADNFKFFSKEEYIDGTEFAEGEDIGVIAEFSATEGEQILLRTGISYVDLDGARNNLETEIPDFDFDKVKTNVENLWEDAISVAMVDGDNETDKTLFYTCLYHALLDPRTNCDADGRAIQADGTIYKETRYQPKTVFSGWDVYRSEFPLLTVIRPDIVTDTINSLMRVSLSENKALPRWEIFGINTNVMVGDPGIIVAADTCVKGLKTIDDNKLYDICRASSLGECELFGREFTPVRKEAQDLTHYGYVPGSLSFTLEDLFELDSRIETAYDRVDEYIDKALDKYEQYMDRDYEVVFDKLATGTIVANGERFDVVDIVVETKVFDIDDAFDAVLGGNNFAGNKYVDKIVNKLNSTKYTPEANSNIYSIDAYKATLNNRTVHGISTGTTTVKVERYLR